MKNNETKRFAFILSLSIHAALALVILLNPNLDPSKFRRQKSVEVELIDTDKLLEQIRNQQKDPLNPKGQIVDQDKNQLNDEEPEDAKFLSRHNQKVVRETQAALRGKFKNTDETGGKQQQQPKVGKQNEEKGIEQEPIEKQTAENEPAPKEFLTSPDGVASKGKPSIKDLTPSFKPGPPPVETQDVASGGGQGPSATDDHLKNVATGMQTLLSTREFVYFSYYNRIKDRLRQYWEPKIKEKMERIVRQGRTIASSTDRVTRIVIVLDTTGTLVRIQVIGPSGIEDLDEAAVEAFRAAAPFPNPPKGIEDPDGTIKIRWDFILEASSSSLINNLRVAGQKL
jgi:TonB family protein